MIRSLQIFLIFFILASANGIQQVYGQSDRIDSLMTLLESSEEDTNRILILIDISAHYSTPAPEKAINYAERARRLSKKLNYTMGLGMSYERIGRVHVAHSNYQQAIENLKNCIKIYEQLGLKDNLPGVYNTLGTVFYYLADYDKAIEYYFKYLKVNEELGNKRGISSAFNNIGIIYSTQNNHQKSLEYHFKSLGIDQEIENEGGVAASFNNIGEIYREQGKYDKALKYYQKSLAIREKTNNVLGMSSAYGNIGLVYQHIGELDKSLEYQLKGLKLKEQVGDSYNLFEGYNSLGEFYLLTKNYEESKKYFNKALKAAANVGMIRHSRDATAGLSKAFALQNDFKKAYEYQIKTKTLSDSILYKESLKKITQIEMQAEFDRQQEQKEYQRQKQLTLYKAEQRRQKIVIYALVIGMILMLLLAFAIYRSYRVKKMTNRQLEKQKLQIIEEKKKSEDLLLNILPKRTADELKKYGRATSKHFEKSTVMFADFVSFTKLCENLNPLDLIYELDYYFSEFDSIIEQYKVEKIKTIGDAYLCAGGIPYKNDTNPIELVLVGLEIQQLMHKINEEKVAENKPEWKLRLGIHTGELVTGVVGTIKFAYDIWGDTVNVAARLEQTGEPCRVNISNETYQFIKDYFDCTYRGKIEAKNKGEIEMYFVDRLKPEFSADHLGIMPNKKLLEIINI